MGTQEQHGGGETTAARRERFRQHFYRQVQWSDLDPAAIAEWIDRAIREDIEGAGFSEMAAIAGDPTSELLLSRDQEVTARVMAREDFVAAGFPLIPAILERFDPHIQSELLVGDGAKIAAGSPLARLSGPARAMFTAERTLLNAIQMLSGIATCTERLTRLLEGSSTRLLDTRKTPPGYRALAKYAVACGGGWNHRLGLFDRIMLKDNHVGSVASQPGRTLASAIEYAKSARPDLPVEVEIDSLNQLADVLAAQPDVILLDNFSPESIREAIAQIDGRALTEISGNVTEANLPNLAPLGADFISTGATVHQSRWVDIGLDLEP